MSSKLRAFCLLNFVFFEISLEFIFKKIRTNRNISWTLLTQSNNFWNYACLKKKKIIFKSTILKKKSQLQKHNIPINTFTSRISYYLSFALWLIHVMLLISIVRLEMHLILEKKIFNMSAKAKRPITRNQQNKQAWRKKRLERRLKKIPLIYFSAAIYWLQ